MAATQRFAAIRSIAARAPRDDVRARRIERVWQAKMQVYGADEVLRELVREGTTAARCTVERLMRRLALAERDARPGRANDDQRQQGVMPVGQGQPAVPFRATKQL